MFRTLWSRLPRTIRREVVSEILCPVYGTKEFRVKSSKKGDVCGYDKKKGGLETVDTTTWRKPS